jgi:hypothetical protein
VNSWEYGIDKGGVYSVKVNYLHFCCLFATASSSLDVSRRRIVESIWESLAPLKMVIFSWQAILKRLPTRRNLAKRGASVLDGQDGCL